MLQSAGVYNAEIVLDTSAVIFCHVSVCQVSGCRCCRGDETENTKIGSLEPHWSASATSVHAISGSASGRFSQTGKLATQWQGFALVSNGRLQACRSFYEMLCVSQAQNACFLVYLQGLANGKDPLAAVQFIDYA